MPFLWLKVQLKLNVELRQNELTFELLRRGVSSLPSTYSPSNTLITQPSARHRIRTEFQCHCKVQKAVVERKKLCKVDNIEKMIVFYCGREIFPQMSRWAKADLFSANVKEKEQPLSLSFPLLSRSLSLALSSSNLLLLFFFVLCVYHSCPLYSIVYSI